MTIAKTKRREHDHHVEQRVDLSAWVDACVPFQWIWVIGTADDDRQDDDRREQPDKRGAGHRAAILLLRRRRRPGARRLVAMPVQALQSCGHLAEQAVELARPRRPARRGRPPPSSTAARPSRRGAARASLATAGVERQPAVEALGDRRHGAVVERERDQPGASGGSSAASARLTSAAPEWPADTGQDARRRGLGGDHPERLGEGAREDQGVACGHQAADLVVLEPAGEGDAAGRRLAPPRA